MRVAVMWRWLSARSVEMIVCEWVVGEERQMRWRRKGKEMR